MAVCGRLDVRVVVIEGRPQWTMDGLMMADRQSQWTIAQHRSMVWSLMARGIWVDYTDSLADTAVWLHMFEKWLGKPKHVALDRRPGAVGAWGKPDQREYGVHLLQGLPGVGPELAGRIWDEFGGVPWGWTVDESQLTAVPGIGPKRAQEMLRAIGMPTPPE